MTTPARSYSVLYVGKKLCWTVCKCSERTSTVMAQQLQLAASCAADIELKMLATDIGVIKPGSSLAVLPGPVATKVVVFDP